MVHHSIHSTGLSYEIFHNEKKKGNKVNWAIALVVKLEAELGSQGTYPLTLDPHSWAQTVILNYGYSSSKFQKYYYKLYNTIK